MSVQFPAPNPLEAEVRKVLQALADRADGRAPAGRLESHHVDLKEEAGRRPNGRLEPGTTQNEKAAQALAEEAACMANSPGGGALIVGAADDGQLIGTELDPKWLHYRLWQLTDGKLPADVQPVLVNGVRLLVLTMREAIEPIRFKGRIKRRIDDHCVEIDATTWHAQHLDRIGFDWSAQPSVHAIGDARATALQVARDYLRATNEPKALDLASTSDTDLLRRLGVTTPDGYLTNAGAITFVGRTVPALDYIRRDVTGGDSRARLNESGRGLLEELYEVERTIAAYNPTEHIQAGLVVGQIPQLPPKAVREAIVNGLAHRDWNTSQPTTVEHIGTTIIVSSPGGFIGGINAGNIITHTPVSKNPALALLLATLRVAEREGIGVDRMVRDMIRVGLAPPSIEELDGPLVRTALVGGSVDRGWLDFLADITPASATDDLEVLLVLRVLAEHGWVDAATAGPVLQRPQLETEAALARLRDAQLRVGRRRDTEPRVDITVMIIQPVAGTPPTTPPAWCWNRRALEHLGRRGFDLASVPGRQRVAARYARLRGRISTTELASIASVASQHANRTLKELESDGILAPGREVRAGRGFFYVPVAD